jgi:serine/threonine-protein kinase
MAESPAGAAVLIAGDDSPAFTAALRDIADVLRSFAPRWRVTPLLPGADPDHLPQLANIERTLVALGDRGIDVALIVAVGEVIIADGVPALIATADSIRLTTIGALARASSAAQVAIVFAGWTGSQPPAALEQAWSAALATGRAADLAVVAAGPNARPTIEALRDGLAGAALDPTTGTVTVQSIADYLARDRTCWIAPSSARADTALTLPPLSRLDPQQLIQRTAQVSSLAAEEAAPAALLGTMLPGQFRIDAVLASGGFGTVYRARQLSIDRDVAIKVLHADVDPTSPASRSFIHEIQSIGRIDHPNIVRVYQADLMRDGRIFFAMELLTGGDLEQLHATHAQLAVPRALAIFDQLLAGLEAAHDAGLIHADVKPANVLLGDEHASRVVLVDFGLARLRSSAQPARAHGGTPAYMAPEQLRGDPLSPRADLFSAALVLVTLVTGWRRRSAEMLVPPLDAIADRALRRVLERALAIVPAERFATATELRYALADLQRRRRRGLVRIALACLVFALAVGGVIATRPPRPTVYVGGSGTVLFGFFQPIQAFLEHASGARLPIESKFDLGSGGAIRSLRAGEIEIATMSTRFTQALPVDLRAAGKLMVEVPIGYDETALFVHRENPLRAIDLAPLRDHLCCGPGQRAGAVAWRELGMPPGPLADHAVGWTLFGRTEPPVKNDTTSSTVLQADAWLCAPRQLCPTVRPVDVEANDVLAQLVTSPDVLALSTRSFATDRVTALRILDSQRHTHFDGRKILWLYLALPADQPMPRHLCRVLDAVLAPEVTAQLALQHRAQGLSDPLRRRQRGALGLDDDSCDATPLARRATDDAERAAGVLKSPIADALEIHARWVAD